jgi:hypothetical protein
MAPSAVSPVPIVDPLIGLAVTLVILRITWQSWLTVAGHGGQLEREHHTTSQRG